MTSELWNEFAFIVFKRISTFQTSRSYGMFIVWWPVPLYHKHMFDWEWGQDSLQLSHPSIVASFQRHQRQSKTVKWFPKDLSILINYKLIFPMKGLILSVFVIWFKGQALQHFMCAWKHRCPYLLANWSPWVQADLNNIKQIFFVLLVETVQIKLWEFVFTSSLWI